MTVAAELALSSQQLEYFVTIEGIGWPTNGMGGALSGGFDGVVFATNDINGDLATQLGCTVYKGLQLPDSISESIDPRTCDYNPSGLSLSIQDNNDWWVGNCTPRRQGVTTTLNSDLECFDTVVRLSDGTSFDEDDVVWVGGRECILLGVKALVGGTIYTYTGSTRKYLGTRKGSVLRLSHNVWYSGTSAQTIPWWWWNRKAALWAHVPGESSANCQCMWFGALRGVTNPKAGVDWKLNCTGDVILYRNKIHRAYDWRVSSMRMEGEATDGIGHVYNAVDTNAAANGYKRLLEFGSPSIVEFSQSDGVENLGAYELANAYCWRAAGGGFQGMKSTWDGGGVQALDIGAESDLLYSYVMVDDSVYLMLHKEDFASNADAWKVVAEIVSSAGKSRLPIMGGGEDINTTDLSFGHSSSARFLLDNTQIDSKRNRFAVDGIIRRNPIDVALIFMLSTDREMYVKDAAGGSTATVVQFAATGASNDALIGYALFRMESGGGAAVAQGARIITDNDATSITVERGFGGAPGAGDEMQVRNSIYDVLPFGWGCGFDALDVDTDSFEAIRDKHLPDAELGDFILGAADETDIWDMVQNQILKPYGVLVYFDYSTRKLTGKYIGVTAEDGAFEDYTAINDKHILDWGDINTTFSNPVGVAHLKIRAVEERIVGVIPQLAGPGRGTDRYSGYAYDYAITDVKRVAALQDGNTKTIQIRSDEANIAFSEHELDVLDVEALLNTEDDFISVAGRISTMVREYSVPPSVIPMTLDVELYQSCIPGAFVVINWSDSEGPANPLTGSRGWSDVIGRIVSRRYPFSSRHGFEAQIEILLANRVGRIAPAAMLTGKGSDGFGAFYICSTTDKFVADPDNEKDWHYFAVGDEVHPRDENGAVLVGGTTRTITAFGATQESDPKDSGDTRIYVDGAIGAMVVAGTWLTFDSWDNGTTRMQKYSAYADANETLGAGSDDSKVYG